MARVRSATMALWRRFFAGHPGRVATAAVAVLFGAAAAWYLGSPLFLKTYAEEALPMVTAAQAQGAGASRTLASGQLRYVDSVHNGTGTVSLVEIGGKRFVRFENVAIQNGPDLQVYLSTDTGGRYAESSSLYLGALKATNGSFNYELAANVDVARFRSVIVWCRAFSVLFTWADLTA